MIAAHRQRLRAVLVSTPWPLFNRPSIQLGSLKAFLAARLPQVRVDTRHFYLDVAAHIGFERYRALCERTWPAECVYAALLYPSRLAEIADLFGRELPSQSVLGAADFEKLVEDVGGISQALIAQTDWRAYRLAGFSVTLSQLTAALFFIRAVKRTAPDLYVVVGGSTFSGMPAAGLLRQMPEIDAIASGEGERPLEALLRHLCVAPGARPPEDIEGLTTRQTPGHVPVRFSQMTQLDRLPAPDYDDYFAQVAGLPPHQRFFPTLPVEMSRGCWWRRPRPGSSVQGCAFCNLNLQWRGYRSKSAEQITDEIEYLSTRHQCLSLAFMDNVLPAARVAAVFGRLAELGRDFKFFAEIRADFSLRRLAAMEAAGVEEVQVGIEALSTSLLAKLNKGTTAIENLEAMKNCEAVGIVSRSNLIIGFPGSDDRDVAQTLANLEFAAYFQPLRVVQFWLGYGSPVYACPRAYGLQAVFSHPYYGRLLPPSLRQALPWMIQAYRGDRMVQRRRWQPVKARVRKWARSYAALHADGRREPILSFRDGGDFIILRQKRLAAEPMTHRLTGTSRRIYLFCQHRRSLARIRGAFPHVGEDRLRAFLAMLVEKKLMFTENGQYLSLAAPGRIRKIEAPA